ncbi:hypothetical protein BDY17DRAFT_305756 [Neohortaea acidophila]|uniref:Uncharacterized protein n=1 Tax=Neohortaea acidophila TaxID=245834 RepID=A0A6A6PG32_9PEZI|nr:uncharacterized protein BDY17DRAFT_305756 [Neohortaea acidophila]KAF2478736.1 hypothetical protein BDY17DRAFT_305756 [Neohortaea acidophila]
MEPRKPSTETDRRHLLASSASSIAPSDSVSVITARHGDNDGDATPRARSPARSIATTTKTSTSQPYRGFPSEEAYLAALRAWADGQKFTSFDTSLIGFYGERTAEEIASQPRPEFGLRKKWRARRERKNSEAQAQGVGVGQTTVEQRRGTVG